MKIGGQGKFHKLTGVPKPPQPEERDYMQWEQDDLIVCSWMPENMEPDLANQYAEFPMTKELWKGMFATYNKSKDGVQLFNLIVHTNSTK